MKLLNHANNKTPKGVLLFEKMWYCNKNIFHLKTENMKKIRLVLFILPLIFFCQNSVSAQMLQSGDIIFDIQLDYTVFDILGKKVSQKTDTRIDFSEYSNGVYLIRMNGVTFVAIVQNGWAVGIRSQQQEFDETKSNLNQICVTGEEGRPFGDTETFKMYIHQRIDHLTSDSAKACELTRIATEWYPQALHAHWVTQSWMYSLSDVFQHFLQADSMGMCGDQAVFLSNLMYHFLNLRSCAIGMGHANSDSSSNYFSHVQLLLELPVDSSHIIWAIFDSQNGLVYRDSLGNIIDFREVLGRSKNPIADEMYPRGRMYNISYCHDKDYSSTFPFNTLFVAKSNFHPVDSIVTTGERSLSFVFRENTTTNNEWKIVGMSYGFIMDTVSPKQLADMSPLFTNNIWETTSYTENGIPQNIAFANEVRNFTQLYGFKKEDYLATFQNAQPKRK